MEPTSSPSNDKPLPNNIVRKSAARLAAVQAIYSSDIEGFKRSPAQLVLDMMALYANPADTGNSDAPALPYSGVEPDNKFLERLVHGVLSARESIDALITEHLAENWQLSRLDAVVLAVLRVGVYELQYLVDIPTKVVLNEYIEVARAFVEEADVKFTNGILDRIGKKVRN